MIFLIQIISQRLTRGFVKQRLLWSIGWGWVERGANLAALAVSTPFRLLAPIVGAGAKSTGARGQRIIGLLGIWTISRITTEGVLTMTLQTMLLWLPSALLASGSALVSLIQIPRCCWLWFWFWLELIPMGISVAKNFATVLLLPLWGCISISRPIWVAVVKILMLSIDFVNTGNCNVDYHSKSEFDHNRPHLRELLRNHLIRWCVELGIRNRNTNTDGFVFATK